MDEGGDDPLAEYRRKRDFSRTPEPAGVRREGKGNIFVVQKHQASGLHYDLRLQLHGALKSWALPHGPSLDPQTPRKAMQTEDHPLAYADFEGVIPENEYGAGTVLIWDRGEWEPLGEGKQGYYRGRLLFRLHGERLKGGWSLLLTEKNDRAEWLLTKAADEFAGEADLLAEERSVASGRTMGEIALQRDLLWTRREGEIPDPEVARLPGATRGELPVAISPLLAAAAEEPPAGEEWLHEIKYDGYRLLCRLDNGAVEFFSRRGERIGRTLPRLREEMALFPARQAWLDGEMVVFNPDGTSSFERLQGARLKGDDGGITYLLFDILHLNGFDLRPVPLAERKKLLARLVPAGAPFRYVDHLEGEGAEFYAAACGRGLEGVVSKRADSRYRSGRSGSWLKIKCGKRQEFVIGGYTESTAGRLFGSLLAGYYRRGRLVFAGKVKTGYSAAIQKRLMELMRPLEQESPPFEEPPSGPEYRNPHWLKPLLVAEVDYTELAADGRLRHASFKGLRDDKRGEEVVLEQERGPTPHRKGSWVFPGDHLSRRDVVDYYSSVAARILPHLLDRPLTLIVCRHNIYSCKFTKHATNFPPVIRPVTISGHAESYIAIDSEEGLLTLVELGAVEFHPWGSRVATLEYPDRLVFDLDPPEGGLPWEQLVEGALEVRRVLHEAGMESFVMTTGGKGYYVIAPLSPSRQWPEVTSFARHCAEATAASRPDLLTARLAKEERRGRIFVDWMRNGRGSHAAAPYSLRARPGAPVATPVSWDELLTGIRPDAFSLKSIPQRLATLAVDPWQGFPEGGD